MGSFKNEFAWSKSRQGTFDTCRRQYWFQYYGSWGGWVRGCDKRTRKIYILKQLQSRYMWVGAVVHDAVEGVVRALRGGMTIDGINWKMEREKITRVMRDGLRFSKDGEYRMSPKSHVALLEHEYGQEVDAEEWKATHAKAFQCFENFQTSLIFQELALLEDEDWLEVEEFSSFRLNGLKVWVKMDVSFRNEEGGITIVDWKTGKPGEPSKTQLACYALYASEKWGMDPTDITVIEYNLRHQIAEERKITLGDIEEVKRVIERGADSMAKYIKGEDREKNESLVEAGFAAVETDQCRWCNFRKVCPEGEG